MSPDHLDFQNNDASMFLSRCQPHNILAALGKATLIAFTGASSLLGTTIEGWLSIPETFLSFVNSHAVIFFLLSREGQTHIKGLTECMLTSPLGLYRQILGHCLTKSMNYNEM
jgi:hypothetical protein